MFKEYYGILIDCHARGVCHGVLVIHVIFSLYLPYEIYYSVHAVPRAPYTLSAPAGKQSKIISLVLK